MSRIKKQYMSSDGFTLLELLTTISIVGILATIIMISLGNARETSRVAAAIATQGILKQAAEQYNIDMGFYPPDVNRGWDPGFRQPMPANPDSGTPEPPTGAYAAPGTNCSHCPSNWDVLVQQRWAGPYIAQWPRYTPWRGKYDYNYWATATNRFGCVVSPGVYVGIQGDYNNNNTINLTAESKMIAKGTDSEQCINGESQMQLRSL